MFASALDILGLKRRQTPVTAGSVYSHRTDGATTETAKVLSVGKDRTGIAHVWFRVTIQRDDQTFVDEVRVLSAQSFLSRFCQRCDA